MIRPPHVLTRRLRYRVQPGQNLNLEFQRLPAMPASRLVLYDVALVR